MSLNTTASKSVTEALDTRITVREYLDKPVPDATLREILDKARRTPSGGNLQPWRVHVMRGDKLAAFKKDAMNDTTSGKQEEPTHQPYPSPLWEPQRSWRYKLGEDMYALLGIEKDNKMGRLMWLARNSLFFDAPVGIIITGNKALNAPQYFDVGIYLQSLMLLAREHGLHTAPQGWWRHRPAACAKHLSIPDDEEVLVGMAMGYGNPDAIVNNLRADRAGFDELIHIYD